MNETTNQLPEWTASYPEPFRPFAHKLMGRMENALKVEDDRRKHGQICKILNCLSDPNPQPARVLGFWNAEAKELAKEWEALRVATLQARADRAAYLRRLEDEDRARQAAASAPEDVPAPAPAEPSDSAPETPKAKRAYQKIEYTPGVNPFREGSRNAKVFDLLLAGGRTKEQLAEESGADLKSVGYVIWLLSGPNQIPVTKDKTTKTYKLLCGNE